VKVKKTKKKKGGGDILLYSQTEIPPCP